MPFSKTITALAHQAASDEINTPAESLIRKKNLWLQMAENLESEGVAKPLISSTIITLIEDNMKTISNHRRRFHNSWFSEVMRTHGYTNIKHNSRTSYLKDLEPIEINTGAGTGADQRPKKVSDEINSISNELQTLRLIRERAYNEIYTINKIENKINKLDNSNIIKDTDAEVRSQIKQNEITVSAYLKAIEFGLKNVNQSDIKMCIDQLKSINLDERMTLTIFEKAMALLAIDCGQNRNEIAKLLSITTKHMKTGIEEAGARDHILKVLKWFGRCVCCGANLHDEYQAKVRLYKLGLAHAPHEDHTKDILLTTTYQAEVYRLKLENSRLQMEVKKCQEKS